MLCNPFHAGACVWGRRPVETVMVEGRCLTPYKLADHKAAVNPAELTRRTLRAYAALCGEVLAKGHARTGDAARLAGYMGKSAKLDDAIAAFAGAYADQVKSDYRLFKRFHRAI